MDIKHVALVDVLEMLCVGLVGVALATTLNNDLLSAEMALLIAFLINIIAISYGAAAKIKDKLRRLSASLLFGTLIGVILP